MAKGKDKRKPQEKKKPQSSIKEKRKLKKDKASFDEPKRSAFLVRKTK